MSSAIDYDFNKPNDIPIPAKMMNLHIPDRQSLYNCYMPFLEHGGLFIATNDKFSLGDEVLLALSLGNSQEKKFLRTNVAWINLRHIHRRAAQRHRRGIRQRRNLHQHQKHD